VNTPRVLVFFSGVLSLAVGAFILVQWPASSLWVIGTFLGVDLVFAGASWIGVGLTLRRSQ